MLEVVKVTRYFGGLAAVKDIDLRVGKGEIVGLIGPNGAGKTTLFNVISGLYRPTSGTIKFEEKDITKLEPHIICKLGVGRTYQIARPFLDMTALENVVVGVLFGSNKAESITIAHQEALRYLEFVGLERKRNWPARRLTAMERKMLEIARALATRPKIVLLDEVVAGLNPTETLQAMELIRKICYDLGVSVLWIEHVMKAVMEVAQRIIVLHHGEKIAEGTPQEIANSERVIDAYLGERIVI